MKINKKELLRHQAFVAEQNINRREKEMKLWAALPLTIFGFYSSFGWKGAVIGVLVSILKYIHITRVYHKKNEMLKKKYKITSYQTLSTQEIPGT